MNKNNFVEKIKNQIEKKHLKMKPKFYFLLENFLVIFGFVLIFITALFFTSFILFIFNRGHFLRFLNYNIMGFKDIIFIFPWLLLIVFLLLLVVLELLIKRFKFIYRYPLSVSFILFASGALFLGVIFVPVQRRMSNMAQNNKLPFFGRMYRYYANQYGYDVYTGKVLSKNNNLINLKMDDGRIFIVEATGKTMICGDVSAGEDIIVMAKKMDNNHFSAWRIKNKNAFNCRFNRYKY